MNHLTPFTLVAFLSISATISSGSNIGRDDGSRARALVDETIRPLMRKLGIPGMAIAITIDGKEYFFNYGVVSKETQQPVTRETLFEIGSLSKTFAATLASYAEQRGRLSITESAATYLPALRDGYFDYVSLINLGTHTSELPLFVPDDIRTNEQLMDYLKQWRPPHSVGTHRIYSNIGIGLLGMIAAQSLHETYEDAVDKDIFQPIGMVHTYFHVSAAKQRYYAQGYNTKNQPLRLNDGVLASEAYGVRTTASDLIRFLEANMLEIRLDGALERAIAATHIGYFKSGELTQDLVWEQYPYPVKVERLLAGNSATGVDAAAFKIDPPLRPQMVVLVNKTGTTNGFAAYAAFIPSKKIGIVTLANRSYPIDARVTAAYHILTEVAGVRVSP